MNAVKRFLAPVGVVALALSTQAHAALPTGAAEAIETYETDVVAAIGLMIAAGIAIFAVKKLGSKMGWL
ncbi:major capsid protein [Pseudorhodoferax sp.]|uniref:major capsid protein n=1 Tax=Pseudorhodoferax sp. TaxID=1993553 RepID=UPI0039E54462